MPRKSQKFSRRLQGTGSVYRRSDGDRRRKPWIAVMNTHNPLLDALLSKKYEEASRKGVMLYFDLPDLRDFPMNKTDLVLVFSNLLNNAVDAAAKADPPEVYVRARKNEQEVVLSVRNRVQKNLDLTDGQLPRTTKKEPGHGIGLWNVKDVLAAYGGEYTISCLAISMRLRIRSVAVIW